MFEQYPITVKMHMCHAIFNPFVGQYYADDKYGIIQDKKQEQCR